MTAPSIAGLASGNRSGARESASGKLTPTQFRVLEGVHLGHANKQIAFDLGISEATVKAHMTALMRKLNVHNRTQVALLAEKLQRTARHRPPHRPGVGVGEADPALG